MKQPSSMPIDTEIILRCLAIAAVVWNHSHLIGLAGTDAFGYGGGTTFLMLLCGYNLARFGLHNSSVEDFKKSCVQLALRIILPTMAVLILSIPVDKGTHLEYFLFISNWFPSINAPGILHLWFPEVIAQIMLFFWLLFSVKPIAGLFQQRPVQSLLVLFFLALILCWSMQHIWNPPELMNGLPHIHLWNFVLGMLIFFTMYENQNKANPAAFALILSCAVLGAYIEFGVHKMSFWWLIIATALWLTFPRVTMRKEIARAFHVVGQSAFTIFLLHAGFLFLYRHVFVYQQLLDPIQLPPWTSLQFIFSFTGSVAAWIILTSLTRAYRVVKSGH